MSSVSRRSFFFATSSATAGALLTPALLAPTLAEARRRPSTASASGLATGKPKPLRHKSIPGFLSAEQLAPHFSAHYGGALRGYLKTDAKLESSSQDGTTIDGSAFGALQRTRAAKANSVVLHELYFGGMSLQTGAPKGKFKTDLSRRFGSLDKWASDFQDCAKAASGWAVLAYHSVNKKLYNVVCDQHATGVMWMSTPLLVIDMYEHAYYLDYKNDKGQYIQKFMQHVDWGEINRRSRAAK